MTEDEDLGNITDVQDEIVQDGMLDLPQGQEPADAPTPQRIEHIPDSALRYRNVW